MFTYLNGSIMRQLVAAISGAVALLLIITSSIFLTKLSDETASKLPEPLKIL